MAKSKQVIFLGAGASASDGAPLQDNLFTEYFRKKANIESTALRDFFENFYGIDVSKDNNAYPTFEELLGILEIALLRAENFKGYSLTPSNPDIQKIREELIFLIAKILKDKLQNKDRTNHDKLIEELRTKNLLQTTTFISLNYDILIDNALTDIHDHLDLDYGINFTNFDQKNDWHSPKKDKAIELLKLHGSLNWLYCPTCTSVTITPKEKSVSTIADSTVSCKKCSTSMIPIIIPPTFFKIMSNFHLQKIWKIAESRLSECDKIIFCGYSFPDADVHIKYLLKRMEINSDKSPDIYIYNHHDGKCSQIIQEEKRRYTTFFRAKERVHFLEESFEHFCQHGIPL